MRFKSQLRARPNEQDEGSRESAWFDGEIGRVHVAFGTPAPRNKVAAFCYREFAGFYGAETRGLEHSSASFSREVSPRQPPAIRLDHLHQSID